MSDVIEVIIGIVLVCVIYLGIPLAFLWVAVNWVAEDAVLAVWFAAFVMIVTLCFMIFLSLVDIGEYGGARNW